MPFGGIPLETLPPDLVLGIPPVPRLGGRQPAAVARLSRAMSALPLHEYPSNATETRKQPLYLSIQATCHSTPSSATAVVFSAVDPHVIAGTSVDEHAIRRAIAYALYGRSGCTEQQSPDSASLCTAVTFVFWADGDVWELKRSGTRLAGGAAGDTVGSLRRVGDADQKGSVLHGTWRINRRLAEILALDGQNPCRPDRGQPAAVGLLRRRSAKAMRAAASPLPARSNACANAWHRSGARRRRWGKRLRRSARRGRQLLSPGRATGSPGPHSSSRWRSCARSRRGTPRQSSVCSVSLRGMASRSG